MLSPAALEHRLQSHSQAGCPSSVTSGRQRARSGEPRPRTLWCPISQTARSGCVEAAADTPLASSLPSCTPGSAALLSQPPTVSTLTGAVRAVQAPPAPPKQQQQEEEVRKPAQAASGRLCARPACMRLAPRTRPCGACSPRSRPSPSRCGPAAWHHLPPGWLCRAAWSRSTAAPLNRAGSPSSPEPAVTRAQGAPKLKVAIIGSGLAGLSTAAELLDQGYEVDVYEQRPFIGGKVASYVDRDGNHIEVASPRSTPAPGRLGDSSRSLPSAVTVQLAGGGACRQRVCQCCWAVTHPSAF